MWCPMRAVSSSSLASLRNPHRHPMRAPTGFEREVAWSGPSRRLVRLSPTLPISTLYSAIHGVRRCIASIGPSILSSHAYAGIFNHPSIYSLQGETSSRLCRCRRIELRRTTAVSLETAYACLTHIEGNDPIVQYVNSYFPKLVAVVQPYGRDWKQGTR